MQIYSTNMAALSSRIGVKQINVALSRLLLTREQVACRKRHSNYSKRISIPNINGMYYPIRTINGVCYECKDYVPKELAK